MTNAPVVLITGASSGIGEELAYCYARVGYRCICLARRLEACQTVAARCKELGSPESLAIHCDVQNLDLCKDAINTAINAFNRIDIFVGNAGISMSSSGASFKTAHYRQSFDTNFFGVLNCLEPLIPFFKTQGHGHIVGIGSLASYRGMPQAGAYGSSKAALHHMLESMRIDLQPFGIFISIIHPGFIKTPLTDRNAYKMPCLLPLERGTQKIFNAIQRRAPIYAFPFITASLARLQLIIPVWIRNRLLKNVRNQKKDTHSTHQ